MEADEAELEGILSNTKEPAKPTYNSKQAEVLKSDAPTSRIKAATRQLVQWTTSDGKTFFPSAQSVQLLDPGMYEIGHDLNSGIFFSRIHLHTEGLIRFKETTSESVVKEIELFWEREALFAKCKLTFKRGILLWGPPGSGKTSTIKMVIDDIIKRQGVVFKFSNPRIFIEGARMFREIQPTTPCVVLMEDLDSILETYNESEVINILDGVDTIDKVIYIATTNYPDKLGARIVNRPSRFDKRIKIGKPNADSRKLYLESLFTNWPEIRATSAIDQWVKDTENLSIAHLKELFVSLVILGAPYKEVITRLQSMRDHLDGAHDERSIGFNKE